jgi:hypothetical protein
MVILYIKGWVFQYLGTTVRLPLHQESGPKILGPTLSIFELQIASQLLIHARTLIIINTGTLAPTVANWPPKFVGILFSALGPIQGHKVQHLLVLGAD